MATQKTPLSQAASPEPGRTQKTAKRSKVARNRLIVGGVVALAVVAGIVFAVTRDGGEILGVIPIGEPARPVPEFAFEVRNVAIEPIESGKQKAQHAVAEETADAIKVQLDELYVLSFLDPESWGDTGEIEGFFTGGAVDQLEADTAALTLGVDAGDTYEYVEPTSGFLKVRVLMSSNGARMVEADTTFRALAEHDDGTFTTVVSTATFFFVKDDGDWRIQAYRVNRDEKPADAPSPTATVPASGDA